MRSILVTAVVLTLLIGCKKSHSGTAALPPTTPNLPPVQTSVGTPAGTPITKTIGPAGGTVLSADGRVELTFPANSVTANTDITIQPVTNTAPNGTGVSYHFMPDGTKFGVPVLLTFHYTDSDANGTNPFLFYIAYQDSSGVWQADFKNRAIDTVAKTASLPIGHFSLWSLGSQIFLFAAPPLVTQNETSDLFVVETNDDGDPNPAPGGEFSMSPMPSATPVPNSIISNWTVNGSPGGNSTDGTLSGTDTKETYTAPGEIDKERKVQVSGTITLGLKGWNKGKTVIKDAQITLFEQIDLLPGTLKFSVQVTVDIDGTSNVYADTYSDSARFEVDVDKETVTGTNYQNYPPNVTPPSGSSGLQQAVWTSDGIGICNVVGILGFLYADTITVQLFHQATVNPYWEITDLSDGTTTQSGGDETPGLPAAIAFIAKDSVQFYTYSNGGSAVLTWTITPIH